MNSNGEHRVGTVVAGAAKQMKWSAILAGVCWWLVTCWGVWLALFVADNLFNLPAGLRLPLALGGMLLAGVGFVKRIFAPAADRPRLERTAIELEKRYAVPENLLINACQFEARQLTPAELSFAQQTITMSRDWAGKIRFSELWELARLGRWAGAALVVVGLWFAYVALFPHYAWNATARFVRPLSDVPPASSIVLRLEPAGDVVLGEGDHLDVRVRVSFLGGKEKKLKDSPLIVWQERVAHVETIKSAGENAPMQLVEGGPAGVYAHRFTDVRRSFAFRVFADNAYTRSVRVDVRPLPRIKASQFRVTPPEYTALAAVTKPGPPSSISGLAGSKLEVLMETDRDIQSATWSVNGGSGHSFQGAGQKWASSLILTSGGPYEVQVVEPETGKRLVLARGEVGMEMDRVPEIDFTTTDRNRLMNPGSSLDLEVVAKDDYGIRQIRITARESQQDKPAGELKQWTYLGPPGQRGPVKETVAVTLHPLQFAPGNTYIIEAWCADFNPAGKESRSRAVVLRIKSPSDMALADNDPMALAFAFLKRTIASQEKANSVTDNLITHLDEAVLRDSISQHQRAMMEQQQTARSDGTKAWEEFRRAADGRSYAGALEPLVKGEMGWVLDDISKLTGKNVGVTKAIQKRQQYVLAELVALLGRIAEERKLPAKKELLAKNDNPPLPTAKEEFQQLKDDLKDFLKEQEKIIEKSKTLMDKRPQDLTAKEEEILGELARSESKWAKFFEEKLTDFSKLPQQDFADASISKELNEVFQEIKMAADALFKKAVELAVPHEQSGLENAKELVQNLEKWLPDSPDKTKWVMEEPLAPADIAMAELPKELEDIVGELLDQEEMMTEDVQDVTSSWMDSIDKGAGWDAMDGPISSMSAKGVTGNQLPNEQEIGGRAGEGRTGRSSGQMVEETAEGKKGMETPTRLSPSPFEQGSVEDSSKENQGGATGGGKLAGFDAEGLRGPTPPPSQQDAPRLAEQQAKIRQEAEALAMKLRALHVSTGDLEQSIAQMKRFEETARRRDGVGVRQSYSAIMDALRDARQTARQETGLHRERVKLPEWMRDEINVGIQDGVPRGYEEMVGEYFRALAERKGE